MYSVRYPASRSRRQRGKTGKRLAGSVFALAGLVVIVNIAIGVVYMHRTYPGTRVGNAVVGNVSYNQLNQVLTDKKVMPTSITLRKETAQRTVQLSSFGVSSDVSRTTAAAKDQRSWLPMVNFFKHPQLPMPVKIDNNKLAAQADTVADTFSKDPTSARLTIEQGNVRIVNATDGYAVATRGFKKPLLTALDTGSATFTVPTTAVKPRVSTASLTGAQRNLQRELNTTQTFRYNDKSTEAKAADIGTWYTQSGTNFVVSDAALRAYITKLGKDWNIHIANQSQLVSVIKSNLQTRTTKITTVSAQQVLKKFTYCTNVRGVASTALPTLKTKLESTYNDSRSWNLDGKVSFTYAQSGCDYTVWLSAADQMSSFGGVCDSSWSCRSGNNVVINDDRWEHASDAWNTSKGTLDNYRSMVINHETGHWLGFAHRFCSGPGQLAPVMQQQSISLQGCVFNPWPTKAELDTLQSYLHL